MYATVYIQKDNEEAWKAIQSKSEWLNGQLASNPHTEKKVAVTPTVPACCAQERPCKHWTYDGANSRWTNTLTGQVKEIV